MLSAKEALETTQKLKRFNQHFINNLENVIG